MVHAFQPGFMVFHGNRLEDLRDLTVGLFRNNPLPPLVPETLLVQSNGMKHWLEMALAHVPIGFGASGGPSCHAIRQASFDLAFVAFVT